MAASVRCTIVLAGLVIAIYNLLDIIICIWSTEDSPYAACRCTRSVNPATFYISITLIDHTCRAERTGDTEVIDATAEVIEQRVVQTFDGMSVTMECALEALCISTYRLP